MCDLNRQLLTLYARKILAHVTLSDTGITYMHISRMYLCDSRSKVLNKNFNLGGTQPTLLYDFTSSLCGVTQGNPAKHKLGARFAQGWRKCFHVLSWNISFTYNIYIYIHILIHCMYIDFIIKAFLGICCLFSRSSGFRICQSSSSKTEKLSCISRASCAQAPRKQKNAFGWSKEGDPRTDDHFLGKKARKIPEEFVHTTEEKRPTTHCSEGKAKESKERCHVP